MADLHRRLLDEIDGYLALAIASVGDPLMALRAVVELHAPYDRGAGPTCKGCEIKGVGFVWHDRCATVLTIAENLGINHGDHHG